MTSAVAGNMQNAATACEDLGDYFCTNWMRGCDFFAIVLCNPLPEFCTRLTDCTVLMNDAHLSKNSPVGHDKIKIAAAVSMDAGKL